MTETAAFTSFDGTRLSGYLTLPAQPPLAVALILQGSGNVAAAGDVSSPFVGQGYQGAPALLSKDLAEVLASTQVASFRYAKRGVEDPAQLPNQNFRYLIPDAVAAVEFLRAEFPKLPVIIVGFSEGGILAVHAATRTQVDGLFLFGTPTRDLRETLRYQFTRWPLLIAEKLDRDHDGKLMTADFQTLGTSFRLPLLGADLSGWTCEQLEQKFPKIKGQALSIQDDLRPLYEEGYQTVEALLTTDMFREWYRSGMALPPFTEMAAKLECQVYGYQAKDDAQTPWAWAEEDFRSFPKVAELRIFESLGHCFAPMEGKLGEVKTSGPFAKSVMERFAADVSELTEFLSKPAP